MPEAARPPRNPSLWLGLAIAFAATLCNIVLFLNPPAQSLIPWLSLVLGTVAVVFIALGVKNLFTQSRNVAGRVLGVLVALLSLLFSAGSIFIFVHARAVPPSTDAPQIGQKAPDFTLPDTNNQPLSLMQLFAPDPGNATVVAPNAVLLVFYRGYWWPYCNLELRGIEKYLPEFKAAGIRPVAISVDAPDVSRDLAIRSGYTFPILSDTQAEVIRQYNLLHTGGGPDGTDIARPAEFLIDRSGTVRWRNLTEDVRIRARASEMLSVAKSLR